MVAALVGAILWAVLSGKSLLNTVDDFQRVDVPGEARVALDARKYVVYYEGDNADDVTPPIEFRISDPERGEPLAVRGYSSSLTYAFGEHAGSAQYTVTPGRAGTYRVQTRSSSERPSLRVAFGESIASGLVRTVLGALGIGAALGITGLVILIVTIVRRYNMRNAG